MGGRRRSSSLQLWEQRAGAVRDSRSAMEMLSMAERTISPVSWSRHIRTFALSVWGLKNAWSLLNISSYLVDQVHPLFRCPVRFSGCCLYAERGRSDQAQGGASLLHSPRVLTDYLKQFHWVLCFFDWLLRLLFLCKEWIWWMTTVTRVTYALWECTV